MTLFASSGIGEHYLEELGIDVVVSNELIEKRCSLYNKLYPKSRMICGDINDQKIKDELSDYKVDIVIASPPCQGISIAGLHRNNPSRLKDNRNYLVFQAIEVVKNVNPKYILFENVSAFGSMLLPYQDELKSVVDILKLEFGNEYELESRIIDCADYGVPQKRRRNLIKIYKKGLEWNWPDTLPHISVMEAIGHLPSIESGEISSIPWHFGRKHQSRQIKWMQHTPTGKSAFENTKHYPRKENGEVIKGYNTTYKRMAWDKPAPTITMRNDAMSSQANVHPGRRKPDGTFTDARVLSLHELFILNSLPAEFNPPKQTSEVLLRQVMGECIPPLLLKKLFEVL